MAHLKNINQRGPGAALQQGWPTALTWKGQTSGLVELQLPEYVQVLLNTGIFTP